MSENTIHIINLDNRQGYPMGSLFKKTSDREIEIQYRGYSDPKLGDQVKLWTDIRDLGRFFKVIAWENIGTTREEGVSKYVIRAETILPVGSSTTHKP